MASLLTIPLELLVQISTLVSTPDLASLRLSCKQIEKSLYEWFSEEFFVKKQFMLTHPSLQTLVDISKHVSLSKRMKHVIIATNSFDDNANVFNDGDSCVRYMEGHADQRTLLSTGIDREMLTEAFLGLVNLETIDIRDFSARRPRDQTRWSSWGATTVQAETGRPLNFTNYGSYSQSQFLSHIFSTIVYALGKADRTLPRFEVLLRQHPAGLPDTSFHIPEFMFPACKPILENLTALFLTLDLSGAPQHSYDRGFRGVVVNQPGQSLRRFLSYTRNLTHLRLNFRKHDHGLNETFIQWLAEPAASTLGGSNSSLKFSPCTLEPEPIDFPSLKELDLGNFRVDDVSLTALISKFSSRLEGLSLFRIGLFPRSATQSIYTTPDTRRNLWFDFFTALKSTQQAKLSHLKIMACNQEYGGVSQFICQDGTSRINGPREFSGKELKAFFNDLESYMPKDWPQARQMDSDNSSDDDDVSEYNEDEDEDEENEDEDDNDDE